MPWVPKDGGLLRRLDGKSQQRHSQRYQWEELRSESMSQIHNGRVPATKHEKSFIILPDGYFNSQRVNAMKSIARQANLVFYLDEFIVKQETCLSERSAVEPSYSP